MFDHLNDKQILKRAATIVAESMKSEFFRHRFEGKSAPTSWEQWRALPIMEKQDLFDNAYPKSNAMLTRPVEGMIVSSTGGSTGVARYTLMTHDEWDAFCGMQAETLRLMGLRADDRVANLFVAGHLWPSFLGVHEIIKRVGAVHVPISANIPHGEIVRLCAEFDVTVLLSLPTLFVLLADIVKKENVALPSLRMLAYAGEHMSEEAQTYVRETLGVERINALAYSSADAGLMGYQCDQCGFGVYHLPTAFQLIEFIDPDSGQAAADGEKGDVAVTNLVRRSMPLIRYRVGDVATPIADACACGDPNPLYHLQGRAGDDFKIGGAFISMRVFEESLATVTRWVSMNYRLRLEDMANQMIIDLAVESPDPNAATEHAEPPLRQAILERVNEIRQGLDIGYVKRFDVHFVDVGSLPRSPITGKVKRLDDRRANPGGNQP